MNDGSQTVTQASDQLTGITPLYVSPETLQGKMHPNSDQYSLAIVYQELLTGTLPYSGKNPRQLAMQHMMAEPTLSAMPVRDVPILTRALSKDPSKRYSSCLTFIQALVSGEVDPPSMPRKDKTSSRLIRKLQGLDTAKEINLASTEFSSHNDLTPPVPPVAEVSRRPCRRRRRPCPGSPCSGTRCPTRNGQTCRCPPPMRPGPRRGPVTRVHIPGLRRPQPPWGTVARQHAGG